MKSALSGKTAIHQAICMNCWPSLSRLPQVGVAGGTPPPRNESDASEMIAKATTNVHWTISGESVLAKI